MKWNRQLRRTLNQQFFILLWLTALLAGAGCSHQLATHADPKSKLSPDLRYEELFEHVQRAEIFSDSKTFVDSIPKKSTQEILGAYRASKDQPSFNLREFVHQHFIMPPNIATDFKSDKSRSAVDHIDVLWDVLTRSPDESTNGSLISMPYPYVVPGGRFREIYYWDSYFTMLGLQVSERVDLIENMVDNFSYLIDTMEFIPNGNRTYYQGRSQPPFYALMVKLLEEEKGAGTLSKYHPRLLQEYHFWMAGLTKVSASMPASQRVVRLADGSILNRYWDDYATPRPESYIEDVKAAEAETLNKEATYRHIRAAAESGWDFSSRWLRDSRTLSTIHTTDIIPIDLNALLYYLELVLAESFQESGNAIQAQEFRQLAHNRKAAMMRYLWNDTEGFFRDYDFVAQAQTPSRSLAAMFPLYFNMVEPEQALRVAQTIEQDFLQAGGVTTTPLATGQQWDAPNGWAPLQWITIQGLRNYNQHTLAERIQQRWIDLNIDVYKRTGKMLEKYNVYDVGLEGGGGEYPVQDGFGWTNGVLLRLYMEAEEAGNPEAP